MGLVYAFGEGVEMYVCTTCAVFLQHFFDMRTLSSSLSDSCMIVLPGLTNKLFVCSSSVLSQHSLRLPQRCFVLVLFWFEVSPLFPFYMITSFFSVFFSLASANYLPITDFQCYDHEDIHPHGHRSFIQKSFPWQAQAVCAINYAEELLITVGMTIPTDHSYHQTIPRKDP